VIFEKNIVGSIKEG